MPGTIQEIQVINLVNYYENPRHAIGSNEEDTLRKLFDAVGVQYMLNLAEDVQMNGLLGNQQIVVVYSDELNKYVVYEGNRRIAAIKLLLNPDSFSFLDRASIERAKRIAQGNSIPTKVNCYITDEQEAFFIMERTHSGEDKGRGTKQWTSREKEAFRVRRSHQKKVSYLIDFYIKQYYDNYDITTVIPFTTMERIFNNREVKKKIGLDVNNEQSFTESRVKMVIDAINWILAEASAANLAVTRLFNKARTIEDRLLPWIDKYLVDHNMTDSHFESGENTSSSDEGQDKTDEGTEGGNTSNQDGNPESENNPQDGESETGNGDDVSNEEPKDDHAQTDDTDDTDDNSISSAGGSRNLPYFFQGLDYSGLNPNDADTHGVSAVCRELQLFSNRKLVATYPIAATFLVRAIIEQAIVYYSKKTNVQGQNKKIWEEIKTISKLSTIIDRYKRNLPNYMTDTKYRQYFTNLFDNYEANVDPLNWVIHRPADFQLAPNTLIELPRKGLLALINYMLRT